MYRPCLVFTLTALVGLLACAVHGDDKPVAREVQAINEALQETIKEAEPAVACILVSRSDAYSKLFNDAPPADTPGKLGGFDPAKKEPPTRPAPRQFPRMRDFRGGLDDPRRDDTKKYDLADPNAVPEAFGSGVVIDGQQLLVLTNFHVLRDATKIYVRLPGEAGAPKGSYADIHAADPRSDLAVLRLLNDSLRPLKAIKFGDGGSVRKGQLVLSLANPYAAGFRDGSPSASWGILSNIRQRAFTTPDEQRGVRSLRPLHGYSTLLQSDVKLNVGCSGGALLNLQGEMIGLTTARAALSGSDVAGGFAVPLDKTMKRIIDRLRAGEEVEYGFLGVVPVAGRGMDGVAIQDMPMQGSPAHKAGLQKDDVIVAVNGVHLHDADDLVLTVSTLLAGAEARLALKGRSELVPVTLAKSFVPGPILAARRPAAVRGLRVDYTSVLMLKHEPLGPFHFGRPPEIRPGVYVSEVQPGSRAASRLRVEDVITHVKVRDTAVPVQTPAEFYREAAKVGLTEPLELTLYSPDWQRVESTKVVIP